jgi:riboflavin kinase/FMN adenylyltransferase
LLEADLGHAARLLGRPYSIAGRVSHGDKLGRQLGFPTANIQMKHRRPALTGVYAVSVEGLAERRIAGVANVGVRPTATSRGRARLEVHLFDWTQNCYGAHIRVNFLHKLRDEHKFESLDALRAQIALDAQTARDWFVSHPESILESA